jgi:hypothetical protein
MESKLTAIIDEGLQSKHQCIECWNDKNKTILENDLSLVKLCILVAEQARKCPNETKNCYIQIKEHGTLLSINNLSVESKVVLKEHTFEDPRETLAAAILIGVNWSNRTITSFICRSNLFLDECEHDGMQQIIMALETPSSPSWFTCSHIFHEYIVAHDEHFDFFLKEHLPAYASASASASSSSSSSSSTTTTTTTNNNNNNNNNNNRITTTTTESNMVQFVIASVRLGGDYNFGQFFHANKLIEEISLACTECGGRSSYLNFTSNGRRLGIGDSFHPQSTTLSSVSLCVLRINRLLFLIITIIITIITYPFFPLKNIS